VARRCEEKDSSVRILIDLRISNGLIYNSCRSKKSSK
jgi:hypothetical protein